MEVTPRDTTGDASWRGGNQLLCYALNCAFISLYALRASRPWGELKNFYFLDYVPLWLDRALLCRRLLVQLPMMAILSAYLPRSFRECSDVLYDLSVGHYPQYAPSLLWSAVKVIGFLFLTCIFIIITLTFILSCCLLAWHLQDMNWSKTSSLWAQLRFIFKTIWYKKQLARLLLILFFNISTRKAVGMTPLWTEVINLFAS